MNTSVEYLVTGADVNFKKSEYTGNLLTIIEAYPKLTPSDQKLLVGLASSLSEKDPKPAFQL